MQIIPPQVTSWVVHLAPIGVCFLIAGEILHMKSVLAELTKLAWCVSFLCLDNLIYLHFSVFWSIFMFPS